MCQEQVFLKYEGILCADQEKAAKMQEKNNMLSLKVLLQSTHQKSAPEKINVLEI